MLGRKISNALEKDSFAVLTHLELRREYKEDYIMVRESKTGISVRLDYRRVDRLGAPSLEKRITSGISKVYLPR